MLTKCGCAIYVHLQLDLLKFYLAILKKINKLKKNTNKSSAGVVSAPKRKVCREREVNREELVSSRSSFVFSSKYGGALLFLIAPTEDTVEFYFFIFLLHISQMEHPPHPRVVV